MNDYKTILFKIGLLVTCYSVEKKMDNIYYLVRFISHNNSVQVTYQHTFGKGLWASSVTKFEIED